MAAAVPDATLLVRVPEGPIPAVEAVIAYEPAALVAEVTSFLRKTRCV